MKNINHMFLLTAISLIAIGLFYGPVATSPILAAPPDICFEEHCAGKGCENNPARLTATCCWTGGDGRTYCQTCEVNTDSGEFENCDNPRPIYLGQPDDTVVAPPPTGKSPSQSTEKCPENSAIDSKGTCTPTAQSPDESSADDDNKPKLPRGDILGELQTNQGTQPQS